MNSISRISVKTTLRHLKEPFSTSLRTVSEFEVIEFEIETNDGFIACGEAVETPAITGDKLANILADLNGPINGLLEGASFTTPLELTERIASSRAVSSAKAAADIAIYNLAAAMTNSTLATFLGSQVKSVGTDVTIPISELADLPDLIESRMDAGFHSFKVKLSMESIELSIQKIRVIAELIGSSATIRVDPNQSWTVAHTLDFLKGVEVAGIAIEYLEQPTPAKEITGLAQIRRGTDVPIMADESCFTLPDLYVLISLEAVDFINLKLLKSGGLTPTLEMAKVANNAGIEAFVGSMMEGDRGLQAAAALASVIAPVQVHDLDASWWATDSTTAYARGAVILV